MSSYLVPALVCGLLSTGCSSATANSLAQGPVIRGVDFVTPDLTLKGTFEAPAGPGKFPALLLLPGSGPTDRDGNSPKLGVVTDLLKSVADALARQGIATYRFDKRAIGEYSASWPKSTEALNKFFGWDKFVGDAKMAFTTLASQPEVDLTRVGILGHSEGALIALQVGSDSSGKTGAPKVLVLMGSTGKAHG